MPRMSSDKIPPEKNTLVLDPAKYQGIENSGGD